MEFGTIIPLNFLTVCCFITVPIVGTGILAYIRFYLGDRRLARNIVITILLFGLLAFLFPFGQLLWSLPIMRNAACCDSTLEVTSETLREMVSLMIRYAVGLTLPGVWLGFIIAFLFVLPTTLAVRHFRDEEGTQVKEIPLPDDEPSASDKEWFDVFQR